MAFIKIGKKSDVKEKQGTLVKVEDKQIAVFRINDKFYAIDNVCPHMGIGLAGGDVDGKIVSCPGHGWRFNVETGKHEIMPVSVKTYKTKVEGDDLFVEV